MTNKKPIRKDRVLIALLVLAVVILIPILLNSGGPKQTGQTTAATTQPDETTPLLDVTPLTDASASTDATTPPVQDGLPSEGTTTETASEQAETGGASIITHVVVQGETIDGVASALNVAAEEVMADNGLVSISQIVPGQTLYASSEGLVYTIKNGQTLTDISITYGVPIEEIAQANGIADPGKINAGQRIVIPGASTDLWQTVIRLSHGKAARFIWPLDGEITSPFGWRIHPVFGTRQHHNGIDIDVPVGTIVHASAPGTVRQIYNDPEGYGTAVVIEHADGYLTVYGHLSSVLVTAGQYVEVGQPIAESGNTGVSTGPHLHFEIRHGEFPIDPQRYLPT